MEMANQTVVQDPWEAAENATVRTSDFFGKVQIDVWNCALIKGQGKVVYDPSQHKQKATAVDIVILPIPEQNITFEVKKNMIAESKDWAAITLPSIKALGLTLRDLNGKYARVTTVPTGRQWTNKEGKTYDLTAYKFLEVYADEAACKAAFEAVNNGNSNGNSGAPWDDACPECGQAAGFHASTCSKPSNGSINDNGNGNDKDKETAKAFLTVIVNNAARGQTDLEVVRKTIDANIAQYPMVAKHFNADSPETVEMIMKAMAG
jgi:hypothetical protein